MTDCPSPYREVARRIMDRIERDGAVHLMSIAEEVLLWDMQQCGADKLREIAAETGFAAAGTAKLAAAAIAAANAADLTTANLGKVTAGKLSELAVAKGKAANTEQTRGASIEIGFAKGFVGNTSGNALMRNQRGDTVWYWSQRNGD